MASAKRKVQKNIKNKNEDINKNKSKIENNEEYQLKSFLKIASYALVFVVGICLLTLIFQKDDLTLKEEENNSNEIIAGQVFNQTPNSYYVLFYDFKEESGLTNAISNKYSNIYTVDLGNSLNSAVLSEEGNKKAETSKDLAINGVTIIKLSENKITDYIEGKTAVESYLNNIN